MQEDAIFVSDDSHAESGTAKELAELKAMLRRQDAEVERLRVQLAATEIEKRKDTEIPDLNLDGIEEFLKKERVTVWMKDACAVLKQYVTAVPKPSRPADVGGKQGEQLSLGSRCVGVQNVESPHCCTCDLREEVFAGTSIGAQRKIGKF